MEEIWMIIVGLFLIFFGIPLMLIKGKLRLFYSCGLGCLLFFLFTICIGFSLEAFDLKNGRYPFLSSIAISLFISLPFVLIVNLIISLAFYYLVYKKRIEL